ncbi:hypothetical protein [Microbispora bryophytorum]|nr:hypothetical protein [Microbispora bryophytorum]MBD3138756.1 hypothetical protein [Microbispora bryophytorum]
MDRGRGFVWLVSKVLVCEVARSCVTALLHLRAVQQTTLVTGGNPTRA